MKNLWLVVLFFSVKIAAGQEQNKINDIYRHTFTALVGNKKEQFKVQKGKPLLLNFGSMYCGPCVRSLLKADSLMSFYRDSLQVFMVTEEPFEVVDRAKKKNKTISNVTVPIITHDSILHSIFKYAAKPHLVWIDKDGKYQGATNHYFLDTQTIETFLRSGELVAAMKTDKPFVSGRGLRSIIKMKDGYNLKEPSRIQIITGHMDGVFRRRIHGDKLENSVSYLAFNYPILNLYTNLFGKIMGVNFFNNQLMLNGVQAEALIPPLNRRERAYWDKENTFCYEFEFPVGGTEKAAKAAIKVALDIYFGLDVQMIEEQESCWIIRNSGSVSNSGEPITKESVDLYTFCKALNSQLGHPIVRDETIRHDSQTNRIEWDNDILKMEFKELKKYLGLRGYTLEAQERTVKRLVITKR